MKRKRMLWTIGLFLRKGALARGRYLRSRKVFSQVGENVRYQPRLVPLYPGLIRLHNNIMVAAGVRFITHDAAFRVLNNLGEGKFPEMVGCIEVMDNVFIGYNVTILPNVRIGSNVIIGAGSTVVRDLEPDSVYAGTPAKKIGSFADFVKNRKPDPETGAFSYAHIARNLNITAEETESAWRFFDEARRGRDQG